MKNTRIWEAFALFILNTHTFANYPKSQHHFSITYKLIRDLLSPCDKYDLIIII